MAGNELDYGFDPDAVKCPVDVFFEGCDLTSKGQCVSAGYVDGVDEMGPSKSDLVYGPGTSGYVITDEEAWEKEQENEEDEEQLWRPPPPPPPVYTPPREHPYPASVLKLKDAPKGGIQIGGSQRAITELASDPSWWVVKASKDVEVVADKSSTKGITREPLSVDRDAKGVLVVVDPKKGVASSQRYVEDLRSQGVYRQCVCMIQRGGADPVAISKLSAALMQKGADRVILEGGIIQFADSYRLGGFASAFSGSGGSVYMS
jgi:hypothetical protein